MIRADDRMGNLFSKSSGRSPSVKPSEMTSRSKASEHSKTGRQIKADGETKADDKEIQKKKEILVNDKHHEELTVQNVRQANLQAGGESDSDTVSLGMSTVSKMSVKTPPPGDMARSRASFRAPTPLRSMDIDQESMEKHREFQNVMKERGYMEKFPSQDLLQQVKKEYRKMAIDWPEDDDGVFCPCPPKNLKKDELTKDRIIELNKHVSSLPNDFLHQPLFDLVQYLVEEANTELEEAYVLYRWLMTQTMDSVVTQNGQMDIPQDYTIIALQRLKRMSLCYADVFAEMVGYTTIECVKITGQMKIYPKDPCDTVTKAEKHTWCAVYLGREWRLVDCFLAAKMWHDTQILRQQEELLRIDPDSSFTLDLNNYYFIPDPEDLILSHFPDRDYWQLLPRWITRAEFLAMPYFRPQYVCLKLSSPQEKITVSTKNGMCRLDINFPKGAGMRFSYRLRKVMSKKSSSSMKASLNNFVFLETSQKQHNSTFLVTLPEKGKYVLEIFGKCSNVYMEHQSHLCSFGITCSHGNHGFLGYPDNDRSEWGPGIETDLLGMVPVTHERGIVETKNGTVDIVFKVPDNLSFFQKVTTYKGGKEQDYCAVHRTEKQKVVFTARPTVAGDSCLQILVKEDTSDGQLASVCNYLLRCSEPNQSDFDIPRIPHGRIGSRKGLRKLGLRIQSPKSSIIYSPESGRVDVNVQTTKAVLLKSELTHYLNGVSSDVSDFVVQTSDKNIVTFTLKLPKHGMYNFCLYGKRPDDRKSRDDDMQDRELADDKDGMILLHNILVICHWPYKDCCEFARTLNGWGKGCRLLCPQKKYLPAGSFLKFRVIVPGADDVAVLDGEDWQHLQKEEGALWDGDIMVDDDQAGSTIMVKAAIDGEYSPILEYQILSSVDYTALKEQRKENSKEAKDRIKKLKASKKWRDPPEQGDVINAADNDNVSLLVIDDDTETESKQTETESETGSRLSVTGSSTSTLKAMEKANGVRVNEESSKQLASGPSQNGLTTDEQSTSSSETDTTKQTTDKKKDRLKNTNASKNKEMSENSKDAKDKRGDTTVAKGKKDNNGVKKKDDKTNNNPNKDRVAVKKDDTTNGKPELEEEVVGNKNVTTPEEEGKAEGASAAGEQLIPRQDKKEVSFALEDDSLRSSSAESDSEDYEDDQESEFESWQRRRRDQEQREEERTILDFSLPVRLLLKRLRGATKRKDKEELRTAMSEYQQKGLSTTEQEFQQARRMLSVLNLRDDIMESLRSSDITRLRIKVSDADRRGFSSEMLHEMAQARARLKAVDHVQRLHVQMTSTIIDVPTLSEIIRYVKPPELVHHVVMAMLLLMKHHEGKTRKWKKSHKRCVMIGTLKLYQNVHHVKIDEIDPTVAARARQILEMYAPDEAGMVSPGVGALYAWVQRVVEEVLSNHDNLDEPIKPANIMRQRRLFKDKKPKVHDDYHDRIRSTSIAAVRLRYNELLKKDKTKGRQSYDVRRCPYSE